MGRQSKYSPEVRERAVRLVFEQQPSTSRSGRRSGRSRRRSAARGDAAHVGAQAERDAGQRPGLTTSERERLKRAGARESRAEARQRDSAQGVGVFRPGGARPPTGSDGRVHRRASRRVRGRADLRAVLPIAPSTYYEHKRRRRDPTRRPRARAARRRAARRDPARLGRELPGVRRATRSGGSCEREGIAVARCTVERLMREMGLRGVVRGPRVHVTTIPDEIAAAAAGSRRSGSSRRRGRISCGSRTSRTSRRGRASSTSPSSSTCSRARIVGWRVSRSLRTDLVLDALEQALHARPHGERADAPQRPRRRNTCRFATPSGSRRPASSARSAASATPTTTRSPRPSSACSRPR